jgi:hypothetical protein
LLAQGAAISNQGKQDEQMMVVKALIECKVA